MANNAVYKLDWHGPAVLKRALDAAAIGMTEVLAECVVDAKRTEAEGGTMPFRYGFLQGSIRAELPARHGKALVAYWGSFDIPYALYQELGTIYIPERRFLRNAADKYYPTLPARTQQAFGSLP